MICFDRHCYHTLQGDREIANQSKKYEISGFARSLTQVFSIGFDGMLMIQFCSNEICAVFIISLIHMLHCTLQGDGEILQINLRVAISYLE